MLWRKEAISQQNRWSLDAENKKAKWHLISASTTPSLFPVQCACQQGAAWAACQSWLSQDSLSFKRTQGFFFFFLLCLTAKGPRSKSTLERETAFIEMPKWSLKILGWVRVEAEYYWRWHSKGCHILLTYCPILATLGKWYMSCPLGSGST